jgi:SAM-dependent methyltransferase
MGSDVREAYGPHGMALLDYERGVAGATLVCEQDGERDDVPAAFWFRREFDPLEAAALDLCRGLVLDLGAGTGVHTLRLQACGHAVTAIDVEPACVEIMRRRGVRDARQAELFEFVGGPFDTVLSICNGLDKVGRLGDLPRFLEKMQGFPAPGGQLLVDSFDLRIGADAAVRARIAAKTVRGRYFGEVDLRLAYRNQSGAPFTALHVDPETLGQVASAARLSCDILRRHAGHYLARLVSQ